MEKVLPFLPFRVSAINVPRFFPGPFPGSREIRLDEFVPDGKRITIRVTR
jgi:hypothetical protein